MSRLSTRFLTGQEPEESERDKVGSLLRAILDRPAASTEPQRPARIQLDPIVIEGNVGRGRTPVNAAAAPPPPPPTAAPAPLNENSPQELQRPIPLSAIDPPQPRNPNPAAVENRGPTPGSFNYSVMDRNPPREPGGPDPSADNYGLDSAPPGAAGGASTRSYSRVAPARQYSEVEQSLPLFNPQTRDAQLERMNDFDSERMLRTAMDVRDSRQRDSSILGAVLSFLGGGRHSVEEIRNGLNESMGVNEPISDVERLLALARQRSQDRAQREDRDMAFNLRRDAEMRQSDEFAWRRDQAERARADALEAEQRQREQAEQDAERNHLYRLDEIGAAATARNRRRGGGGGGGGGALSQEDLIQEAARRGIPESAARAMRPRDLAAAISRNALADGDRADAATRRSQVSGWVRRQNAPELSVNETQRLREGDAEIEVLGADIDRLLSLTDEIDALSAAGSFVAGDSPEVAEALELQERVSTALRSIGNYGVPNGTELQRIARFAPDLTSIDGLRNARNRYTALRNSYQRGQELRMRSYGYVPASEVEPGREGAAQPRRNASSADEALRQAGPGAVLMRRPDGRVGAVAPALIGQRAAQGWEVVRGRP